MLNNNPTNEKKKKEAARLVARNCSYDLSSMFLLFSDSVGFVGSMKEFIPYNTYLYSIYFTISRCFGQEIKPIPDCLFMGILI